MSKLLPSSLLLAVLSVAACSSGPAAPGKTGNPDSQAGQAPQTGAAAVSTGNAPPAPVLAGAPAGNGHLVGFVFDDANRNGTADTGEGRLVGQTVLLLNSPGSVTMAQAESGGDGTFAFSNLAPGVYRVAIRIPDGFVHTSDNSFEVGVDKDGSSREVRFGLARKP